MLFALCRTKNDMQSLASSISVLSCPACGEEYQSEGKQQPMSLRCGHTFCLGEEQIEMTLICNATMSVTCTYTEGGGFPGYTHS